MSRIPIVIAAIMAASLAHAGDVKPKHCATKPATPVYPSSPVPVSTTTNNTTNTTISPSSKSAAAAQSASASKSASHSASNSASNATGGNATGGAGGLASAGASANGQNSTSIASSYQEVRQTPPAFAGNVQPTASCKNAINGGASAPIAGLSFGFGKGDPECDKRETAREFHEMGRPDLAIALLCSTKAAAGLPGCQPPSPVASAPEGRTYTREEVSEIVRKAVSK